MCTRACFLTGVAALSLAPAVASAKVHSPKFLELAIPGMRRIDDSTWVGQLSPHVWIHTTTHNLDGEGYYPANGVIVENERDSLMIDTGWETPQTETLLKFWRDVRKRPISSAFVTHFHADRLAGVDVLASHGIVSRALPETVELAAAHHFPVPQPYEALERHAKPLHGAVAFYPGAGHTKDNVVVYVPQDRVLFGGCLIKAVTAGDLGNLADAVVADYAATVANVREHYGAARYVVPGHGTIQGDSIGHTLAMAKAAAK